MQDRFEAVIVQLKDQWGPVPFRTVAHATACLKKALELVTTDHNVKEAIFTIYLNGLEKINCANENAYLPFVAVEEFFLERVERQTVLYLFQGEAFHLLEDGEFCGHPVMHPKKILFDSLDDAKESALQFLHNSLDQETIPQDQMTSMEIVIDMIDNGSLVPMCKCVFDIRTEATYWCYPERNA